MPFPPELLTPRLQLRPATEADAEVVFTRYGQDPAVSRFLTWLPHCTIEDTRAFLCRTIEENLQGASAGYLIFSRKSGGLLGNVGGRIEGTRMQFGYCLARDAWGNGYATEAATAFVNTALVQPAIWRVQAFCDLENPASARVLEKAGLIREAMLRRYMPLPNLGSMPRDLWLYAKLRDGKR